MNAAGLHEILIAHGALLILPLAVIEGPIVTVVAGLLSAQGYLDWQFALLLLVSGDLIGDVIYYWIGRTGRLPVERIGRRLGVGGNFSTEFQHGLRHNPAKMLIVGKWTHSIGGLVLIGSGMLRLPLPGFILWNLLATLPKSAVLFGFGYFASSYFPLFAGHAALAVALLCILGIMAILLIVRRAYRLRAAGMSG